jgi:rhodanese-related sulfurtransferase
MKKILSSLSLLMIVACSYGQTNTAVVTHLSAERFKAIMNDKNGMIIDLRTPEEISKGHIANAVYIDFLAKDAEQQILKLDKSKTYYVYCASGGRSGDAAEFMEKHGFKRVYNLNNGFDGWKKKGFPVVQTER